MILGILAASMNRSSFFSKIIKNSVSPCLCGENQAFFSRVVSRITLIVHNVSDAIIHSSLVIRHSSWLNVISIEQGNHRLNAVWLNRIFGDPVLALLTTYFTLMRNLPALLGVM